MTDKLTRNCARADPNIFYKVFPLEIDRPPAVPFRLRAGAGRRGDWAWKNGVNVAVHRIVGVILSKNDI